MEFPTYSDFERPLESCYFLFDDEDNSDSISCFAPAIFSKLTSSYNNACTTIDQEAYQAALNNLQSFSTYTTISIPDHETQKEDTVIEKSFSSVTTYHDEAEISKQDDASAQADVYQGTPPIPKPSSLFNKSLSMQDSNLSPFNQLLDIKNSPTIANDSLSENMDFLQLDNLFTAVITGNNYCQGEPFSSESYVDPLHESSPFDDIDSLQLDEFFIINKISKTVNDLQYHSSKGNLECLKQDILSAYSYAQYLEQYLTVIPNKKKTKNEHDMDDDVLLDWVEFIADDNTKVI